MPKVSAGLLLFRRRAGALEVLLVHPGGPLWSKRDDGAWTIPKGEPEPGEDDLHAARREFAEETGFAPDGPFLPLGEIRQQGGKLVRAWACAGDWDPAALRSNLFRMEWPPKSGQFREFPEVDRAAFFTLADARRKTNPAQGALLDSLVRLCADAGTSQRS